MHKISLRSTEIRTPQGQLVLVPNRQVFENPIVNYSRTGERRVDLAVGVACGDDLGAAQGPAGDRLRRRCARLSQSLRWSVSDCPKESSC